MCVSWMPMAHLKRYDLILLYQEESEMLIPLQPIKPCASGENVKFNISIPYNTCDYKHCCCCGKQFQQAKRIMIMSDYYLREDVHISLTNIQPNNSIHWMRSFGTHREIIPRLKLSILLISCI